MSILVFAELFALLIVVVLVFADGKKDRRYKWKRFSSAAVIMATTQILCGFITLLLIANFSHLGGDNLYKWALGAVIISILAGLIISKRVVKQP